LYDFSPESVQQSSGFLLGMDLALAKILGTDDLFPTSGRWLCDFWLRVG